MVQGVLRADGTPVFVLYGGRGFLDHGSAGGSRYVCRRSPTAGRHYVLHGHCAGNSLRDRRVPAAEIMGVGVWTGLDLYRSNKCLLYAGHDTVIDPLD